VKILRLILGTGMRRGEAPALRWADIRLERCERSIKGALTRRGSELLLSDAKTQRSRRVVSLSPAMVRLITEQVAERLVIGEAETLPASWSFRARRHG
jgi:integrase